MDAREHLRNGDIGAALLALQSQVRSEPANAKLRVFLFQLLCVNGEWDRALTQLNVSGDMDAGTLGMVQVYREALRNEALRREIFAGRKTPLIFGDPQQWMALLFEALKLTAAGETKKAQALRAQAFEEAPAASGSINGAPFEWIADGDSRLGPMLEAVVNARYYWIPFSHIANVKIEKPEDLRDIVWTPAQFTWINGGQAVGFIPTRYPGSETHTDSNVRLARRTEWQDLGHETYIGLGQRMLTTDVDDYPLMEVREISFADGDGGSAPADGNA